MNKIIVDIINETFASRRQQRYFYAKANDKGSTKSERKRWKKWAKEYSDKTDFDALPETASEEELDEIVDDNGDFIKGGYPSNANGYVRSKKTSDEVVTGTMGQMGTFGILGGPSGGSKTLKYWAESDMSKALGADDTIKKSDVDYDEAVDHFEDELGVPEDEAEDRAKMMGYDPELPGNKIRLIENPKKYIEEYLARKSSQNDLVKKSNDLIEKKEINPIIKRQITSFKNTLKGNNLTINDVLEYLESDE